MPAAMFAAAHLAPAAAHRQSAHGVTRAAVYRTPPRARALPSSRAGRDSGKARAWWKFGGGAEAAEDTERAAAPAEPSGTSAKKTIDALSALLGEEDAEEEERRREEEADLARAAAQSRLEAAKAAKSERLKTYLSASTATLRAQQLQMLFLDMPIVPPFMQGAFLSAGKDAQTKTGSRRVGDPDASVLSPYDGAWFDANIDEAAAGISLVSSPVDSKARTEELFGEDLTPAFVAYDGEKLPGEFSVPIVPYPYVCLPGSRARLNLFEPRWLTLFAKLLAAEGSDGSTLEGARDNNRIDLGRNPSVRAYEADDDGTYDIVPGKGRFDETPFVGTGAYGSLFRRADGKLAGVGTLMRVEAHDVVVDGQLLSVYAKGTSRFRVLRVRQANPYIVVDAVPMKDDAIEDAVGEGAFDGSNESEARENAVANNIVAGAATEAEAASGKALASLDAVLGTRDEEEPNADNADKSDLDDRAASSRDAAPALESAKGLARVVERLIASDPYYSEAVGLDEAWRDTSLRRDVFEMSDFEVANAMLYATPELALAILACEDDAKRRALTETVASGMEAAVAAGLTPRKARLFKSLGAFAVLFALGFGVACARDLVEANWPQ
jgi:Lon protease-like protein